MTTELFTPPPGRGNLIVLSAPSGTGKTTLALSLLRRLPRLQKSVSFTTRAQRDGEEDGVDYHFIDRQRFEAMAAADQFLEWAEIYGQLYGTGRQATEDVLATGDDLLLVIDVQGCRWVRQRHSQALTIFLLPPSRQALAVRLRRRGTESAGTEAERLNVARDEIRAWKEYDFIIVNDNLETTGVAAEAVILGARQRRERMIAVAESVVETFPLPGSSQD